MIGANSVDVFFNKLLTFVRGGDVEKDINSYWVYIVGAVIVAGILSQILTIEFVRGIIELGLASASYFAYIRSRSSFIKQILVVVGVGLFLLGIYDIYLALR